MNLRYQKGDIVDIDLGQPPKEVKGHEQGYVRPCIVIKAFIPLRLIVIVPCTKTLPKYSLYTIVRLNKGLGGLTSDSFALCHQIRTISADRIIRKKRGQLGTTEILKIHSVLIDTLEL
jgi:mRNA interferase MazF